MENIENIDEFIVRDLEMHIIVMEFVVLRDRVTLLTLIFDLTRIYTKGKMKRGGIK